MRSVRCRRPRSARRRASYVPRGTGSGRALPTAPRRTSPPRPRHPGRFSPSACRSQTRRRSRSSGPTPARRKTSPESRQRRQPRPSRAPEAAAGPCPAFAPQPEAPAVPHRPDPSAARSHTGRTAAPAKSLELHNLCKRTEARRQAHRRVTQSPGTVAPRGGLRNSRKPRQRGAVPLVARTGFVVSSCRGEIRHPHIEHAIHSGRARTAASPGP